MGADTATPVARFWPAAHMGVDGAWRVRGLVVVVVAVVVLSGDSLIGVVSRRVCLPLGGAASWWASTTRKVWKRWLNLALVVLVVVTLVMSLVVFSLWQAAGMLAVVVAASAYGLSARRRWSRGAGRHGGTRS